MNIAICTFPHVKVRNMNHEDIKIMRVSPLLLYEGFKKYYNNSTANKDNQRHFILAQYNDLTAARVTENIKEYSSIVIDFDNYEGDYEAFKNELKETFEGFNYLYYTTSSHTILKPRVRLILFTNRCFKVEEKQNILLTLTQNISNNLFAAIDQVNSFGNNTLSRLPYKIDNFEMEYNEGKPYIIAEVNNNATTLSNNKKVDLEKEFKIQTNNLPIVDLSDEMINYYLNEYKTIVGFDKKTGWVSYDSWLEVGMILHHQYQGRDIGLKKWQEWCCEASEKTAYTWNKFKDNKEKPKTFKTIINKLNKKVLRNKEEKTEVAKSYKPVEKSSMPSFSVNKSGAIILKNTYDNFVALAKHYNFKIGFDIITKRKIINGQESENIGEVDCKDILVVNDIHFSRAGEFSSRYALENTFNSFYNLLKEKSWDGKDRLEDFYNSIKVKPEYEKAKRDYLFAWLQQFIYVSCFSSEFDIKKHSKEISKYILVFQSKQNGGKTTWVKNLMPPTYQAKYIALGVTLDVEKDQKVLGVVSKLIVELGEIGKTFKLSDINAFKAFTGRESDILNLKYVTYPVEFERTTSFIASTNDYYFLKDNTGSTRFLVLPLDDDYRDEKGRAFCCNGLHDIDMLELYRQILESTEWWDYSKRNIDITMQETINEEHTISDTIEELFYEYFTNEKNIKANFYTCSDVLKIIGYNTTQISKKLRVETANFLRKNNFPYRPDIKRWRLVEKRKEVKHANNLQEEIY